MRALFLALLLAACGQTNSVSPAEQSRSLLSYPIEPLPRELEQRGNPPAAGDFAAYDALMESSETEMVRLRRPRTPFIMHVENAMADQLAWTIVSFHGASGAAEPFEMRWIARRVRTTYGGLQAIDWTDTDQCEGLLENLSRVPQLQAPAIAWPHQQTDWPKADDAKTTMDPNHRRFTLWTTWAPEGDLRFSGAEESELGQWAVSVAIALQPCWLSGEPDWR